MIPVLKGILLDIGDSTDALGTLASLEKVSTPSLVKVGVLGKTGAGKSSLMNALLDKRILPTNGFQACTAVPIEVSYNGFDDPKRRYVAEIEFETQEHWTRELKICFRDILDPESDSPNQKHINQSMAGGIAYSKIKAVYP